MSRIMAWRECGKAHPVVSCADVFVNVCAGVATGVSGAAANVAATWYSKAFGSAKAMALSGRSPDDYEGSVRDDVEAESIVPCLLEGKGSQATLFATHAYAEEEDFRKKTGLTNARLLSCDEQDTQVCMHSSARTALRSLMLRRLEVTIW